MQTQRARLDNAHRTMTTALRASHDRRRTHLRNLLQLYNSLNYTSVLARGFAIVRDAADRPLANAAAVSNGAKLQIQFADGRVAARAGDGAGKPDAPGFDSAKTADRTPKPQKPPKPGAAGQGSLF